MEDCHTPLLWVTFIHDTNDCNISMTNPMHGIYLRRLFHPRLDCLFAQCVVILYKQEAEQPCAEVSALFGDGGLSSAQAHKRQKEELNA